MKIAVFYSGYIPGELYGGPVTSIYNFTELLGDENEIFIVCTNHDLKRSVPYDGIKPGWNVVGKANVMYLPDSEYNKKTFSEILEEIKPDLIYASSFFSVNQTYPLFDLSKEKGIPLLLAPRGELNKTALSMKKTKKKAYLLMLKCFNKLSSVYFQATSDEERSNIIKTLKVEENRVFLLPNVPVIPVKKAKLKKDRGHLKICFVGRIVKNKNLLVALKIIIAANAKIEFDIYGPNEDKTYFESCQQIIMKAPSNVIITYKGVVLPTKMQEMYQEYDCMISPTEFENYGQAIVEAMLHDVPVIVSKGRTPWDDIADTGAGYVCSLSRVEEFATAINEIANMDSSGYSNLIKNLRNYCISRFDYLRLKENYTGVLKEVINRKRNAE